MEHAPDAGRGEQVTAEETVKAKWPDAQISHAVDDYAGRREEIWVVSRPQPGAERDCIELLSIYTRTKAEAWEDAAKKALAGQNREFVLQHYPEAFHSHFANPPHDYTLHQGGEGPDQYMVIGNGDTEEEMWEDAASRIGPDRGGER